MPGRSVITLMTDFGWRDVYVAQMKAALLRHVPDARLIDVTHDVPPQNVTAGAFALGGILGHFPPGTVHLAVVDPGVGSNRRPMVAQVNGEFVVCPDNGLITWAYHKFRDAFSAHEIVWRPAVLSKTFHGRDLFAPIAGMLAAGEMLAGKFRPMDDPVLLDLAPATSLEAACCNAVKVSPVGRSESVTCFARLKGGDGAVDDEPKRA